MSYRDTNALLVGGVEAEFQSNVQRFQHFLLGDLKYDPGKVKILLPISRARLVDQTVSWFNDLMPVRNTSVVMLYTGHGLPGGVLPNGFELTYNEWASLMRFEGDLFFINDACYSGTSIDYFVSLGLVPRNALVLASSRANEKSYSSYFLDGLIEDYKNNKPFKREGIGPTIKGKIELVAPSNGKRTVKNIVYDFLLRRRGVDVVRSNSPGFREKYTEFENPKVDVVQHPQRFGKDLDHLLLKM